MKNNNIGFIDSGLGGITVLKDVRKSFPNYNYFYFADNLNNPYGEKTKEQLITITKENMKYFIKNNCKIIILACGTISSNIYDELCFLYPDILFIKTLPDIKALLKKNTKILFMATDRTCKSSYIKDLNNKYNNLNILACHKLATLIEEDNKLEIDKYLNEILSPYKDIDTLVLGCTHYPLVTNNILKYISINKIIKPSNDVIDELKKVLIKEKTTGYINIYNSLKDEEYTNRCYKILKEKD